MKAHQEDLSDVTRYIHNQSHRKLEDHEATFDVYIRSIKRHHSVDAGTKMLEIGTGTGWFPVMCKLRGLNCKGLEISRQLIEFAHELGSQYGVVPDIEWGNAEETDLGSDVYDVILGQSVWEHIEEWELATERVFRALKPGGVFVFSSTSKWSFTSDEYKFPLYGWLPDPVRYRLRMAVHGPEVMKLGIDFNQFRYSKLRKTFKRIGFSEVYDRVDLARIDEVTTPLRRFAVQASKSSALIKGVVLTFADATNFVCVK
jgi:SAM-dependent methyltransferase